MNEIPVIKWNASTIRVDIETGEIITKWKAEERNAAGKTIYIKHRTTKKVELNNNKTNGHIKYTIEYKRQPQTTIW